MSRLRVNEVPTHDLRALADQMQPEFKDCDWRWTGQTGRYYELATTQHGLMWVMGFGRLGMQGAQPLFPAVPEGGRYAVMTGANGLAVQEVPYRNDVVDIDNPLARWIAAASPSRVLALLDRVDALEAEVERLEDKVMGLTRVEP